MTNATALLVLMLCVSVTWESAAKEIPQLGHDIPSSTNLGPKESPTAFPLGLRGGASVKTQLNVAKMKGDLASLKPDLPLMRGARETRIYATYAPAVVLILTNEGIGSGSLITRDGQILTNWHVIGDYSEVGVVFKPHVEGGKITAANVRIARVVRIDQVSDLALLKVGDPPSSVIPIALGDMSAVPIGADVHAIGHPTGESWTYTKGLVSQIRKGYAWSTESGMEHRADVIQTQTPINPGNSGGPLLSDDGQLVGVNSFKARGEALNFAVSVDEVRRILSSTQNRLARKASTKADKPDSAAACEGRVVGEKRDEQRRAKLIVYDLRCTGVSDAYIEIPDNSELPITLNISSKRDGKVDIVVVDTDRDEKWDISYYDTNGDGKPDMVGYHPDGHVAASRFEPYVASR